MVQVAKLSADLTANTSNFEEGLRRADRKLSGSTRLWSSLLSGSERGFTAVGAGIGALVGAFHTLITTVAGGAGLTALVHSSVEAASAIDDTAQRLQISSTELQRYQYAAKLAGIENEILETALTKLNAQIADGNIKYKSTTEALESIAEELANTSDATKRAEIVNDAFGAKLGAKLIPLLSGGVDGLRRLGEEAQRTGNVIQEDTIKQAAALGDQLDILGSTIKSNFYQGFLDNLLDSTGEFKEIVDDPEFAKGIHEIGDALGWITKNAIESARELVKMTQELKGLDAEIEDARLGKELSEKIAKGTNDPYFKQQAQYYKDLETAFRNQDKLRYQETLKTPEETPKARVAKYNSTSDNQKREAATKKAIADAQRQAQARENILGSLQQETDQLQIQVDMYGQKESAVARATKALQINNDLAKAGIVLTDQQKSLLDDQLDKWSRLEEQHKSLEEAEQRRQQAMTEFAGSFSSAFEDAIIKGGKLSDVLKGLTEDFVRLLLRSNVTQPLADAFTNGGGGFFSDIFGKVFGGGSSGYTARDIRWNTGIPSHAAGIDYVPSDTMARIHKGEMIIPEREAAAIRQGKSLDNLGPSINQTFHFAPGVSKSELAQIIPQIRESTKNSVLEAIGRGGRFSQAVGRRS